MNLLIETWFLSASAIICPRRKCVRRTEFSQGNFSKAWQSNIKENPRKFIFWGETFHLISYLISEFREKSRQENFSLDIMKSRKDTRRISSGARENQEFQKRRHVCARSIELEIFSNGIGLNSTEFEAKIFSYFISSQFLENFKLRIIYNAKRRIKVLQFHFFPN